MPTFPAGVANYWSLNNTLQDSVGTNHLTNTNGVTFVGDAADFESSSSQYLSHADPTPLGDEDWTYTFWFKRESFGPRTTLVGKDSDTTGRSYYIATDVADHFLIQVFGVSTLISPVVIADTNWHFLIASHESATNTLSLQIDNGVVNSLSEGGSPDVTSGPVWIGARQYSGFQDYWDGLIKMVGLWRRVLTAPERSDLWNGGAGLPYSVPASGGAVLTLERTYLTGAVLSVPPATGAVLSLPIVGGVVTYQQQIVADGAVAYWPLDDPSGTTARDLIGTRHGTITGGVTLNQAGVNGSKSMQFSVNGQIKPGVVPKLDPIFTLEAWVYPDSHPLNAGIMGHDLYATLGNFMWAQNAGNIALQFNFGTIQTLNWAVGAPIGAWGHLVITGSTAQGAILYINGVSQGSRALTLGGTGDDATMALGNYTAVNAGWLGRMQDCAIYNRALTPAEIQSHYTKRLEGAPFSGLVSTQNMVSYWSLKNLQDSHGTNHLTNHGGVTFLSDAADFESSSSQYLSHADPTPLGDEDWTYSLWFKLETNNRVHGIIQKTNSYSAYIADYGHVIFNIGDSVPGQIGSAVFITDTNWHLAVFWHDAAANTLNVQLDNGTVATGNTTGPMPSNASPLTVGFTGGNYLDGLMKMVGLWRRVLSAGERTALFNSGNGLPY